MTKVYQKRIAPSAERNKTPIGEKLTALLPQSAQVLEIASGTGQHGAHFSRLRQDIVWQYTDFNEATQDSQKAFFCDNQEQLRHPFRIDVTQDLWWQKIKWQGIKRQGIKRQKINRQGIKNITNIYCANMIHIAPWEAAVGLAKGAGALLVSKNKFFLYGPFLFGKKSAKSNLEFSEDLQRRNSSWGVREIDLVEKLLLENGFELDQLFNMPRDNSLLVFNKN